MPSKSGQLVATWEEPASGISEEKPVSLDTEVRHLARWKWASVLALAAFAGICATSSRLFLSDTYMTLYAGRFIWAHGIPTHDTLTVAAHGRAWVDQQWLAQWLFYGAWRLGGTALVGALSAIAIAAAFGMLAALMLARGIDPLRTATWTTVAFFVCQVNTVIRAQSLAYPLFVGLLWILLADERRNRFHPWVLLTVPVIAVWANVHGSALMAAGIGVSWMVYRAIRMGRARQLRSAAAYLLNAAVVSATVIVATPYSPTDVLHYYRSVLDNPILSQYITEWFPATFGGVSTIFDLALGLVLVVTGVAIGRRAPLPRTLLVMTLAAGFAGTQTVRYQVWFAFPAAIFLAETMQAIASSHALRRDQAKPPATALVVCPALLLLLAAGLAFAPGQAVRAQIFCLFAGVVAAVDVARRLGTSSWRRRALVLPVPLALATVASVVALSSTPASQLEKLTPLTDLAAANAYATAHPGARILADDASASALLWHYPALAGRVAFDARLEIFPKPALLGYMHFVEMDSGSWMQAARGYDIIVVSARKNPALAARVARLNGWRILRNDAAGVTVVR